MLKELLINYEPKNEQERVDQLAIIAFIDKNDDAFERTNLIAHITSSAIVVNEAMDKVLFIHHNIYNSWGWVGGHNDGDEDCLRVAIKETKEETGLETVKPYDDKIFMIDTIHVTNHYKNEMFVSDHLHLNITYLLMASEEAPLRIKPDENNGVKWFSFDAVFEVIDELRMVPIYEKAFKAIDKLKRQKA